jgi:outer membrane protein assembly factor BamB
MEAQNIKTKLKAGRHVFISFVCLISLLSVCSLADADWSTYMHDIARSGATSEELKLPLSQEWIFESKHAPQPAWYPPKPEEIEWVNEVHKLGFDAAYQLVATDKSLYFGSSADNKLYCLDTFTGEVRWTFFTGGPIRIAPTVWNDRVFVGSDDGYAYCLKADSGKLIWKFQAAPHDDKLLGNGKMISLWPVRTGVLVDKGIAYFGAGVFPGEDVYMYAVSAKDGELVWRNDTFGRTRSGWRSRSPQGCMLASEDILFVPCGKALPVAFDRKEGNVLYQSESNIWWHSGEGGTYAMLSGDYLYGCGQQIAAYDQKTGKSGFAWFPGRRIIISKGIAYLLTENSVFALDRKSASAPSWEREKLWVKQWSMSSDYNKKDQLKGKSAELSARIEELKKELEEIDNKLQDLRKLQPGEKEKSLFSLRTDRDNIKKDMESLSAELESINSELKELSARIESLEKEQEKAEEAYHKSILWQNPCGCPDSMIMAGNIIFAGGDGKVVAIDGKTGETLWTGEVNGKAKGMAVSDGCLFVTTDKGNIHCFGEGKSSPAKRVAELINSEPYKGDKMGSMYVDMAEQIIKETGVRQGYCLVLGCNTGRLAFELAKHTDLMIYGVDPDEENVEKARKLIDSAGLYGARVTIDRGDLSNVPYSDYFANLIVSENMMVSDNISGSAAEAYRMLKPCGGILYLGQPEQTMESGKRLNPSDLRQWLNKAEIDGFEVEEENGVWVKIERGPLPEAGSWTHQYADAGNTACSDDQIIKCPLGVLWFGAPGPTKMIQRHQRSTCPLSINGRIFIQGDNVVMAYDAYNGVKYWEREIEGAVRIGMGHYSSNIAANDNSFFVTLADKCLRLDAVTGETIITYEMPTFSDDKIRTWNYLAVVGDTLFGGAAPERSENDVLFALDLENGKQNWIHKAKSISHNAIAIGDGFMFFADRDVTDAQKEEAVAEKKEQLKDATPEQAEKELAVTNVRLVVALDTNSGKVSWRKPVDLGGCGDSTLQAVVKDNFLLFWGAYQNGHYWHQFHSGEFNNRRVVAISADSGELIWARGLGYRTRPLVNGDRIYADPWAFDLKTGNKIMRTHPTTGEEVPWEFGRGHHCGAVTASTNCIFFRSLTTAYYDLIRDSGVLHFGGHRPGCHINMIAANGLLIEPEASSGCVCNFSLYSTVVFKPRETDRAWGNFCSQKPITPVKHLAINLGAPGDRRDDDGTLWLSYPRPSLQLILNFNMQNTFLPGLGYFALNHEVLQMEDTDKPWLFSYGCCGITKCEIPLVEKDQKGGIYTVRLGFVDFTNSKAGQRVFDIKIGDRLVMEDFDIIKAAGSPNKAIMKEFKGIQVSDNLRIELIPKTSKLTLAEAPLMSAIEIIREDQMQANLDL